MPRSTAAPAADTADALLPTANFHFIEKCNFSCTYCYATFLDLPAKPSLDPKELIEITRLLARDRSKVTFVGGEPTIYRGLPDMLAAAKAEGALTNIVTNGSRIDQVWLETHASVLDYVTVSIDSASPETHLAMGRAVNGRRALPVSRYQELAAAARALGVGFKVNTVVTRINEVEDMTSLITALAPERWKILQAAPVSGQNDQYIGDLTPSLSAFQQYVDRHEVRLQGTGISVVAEPIETIRGSYVMVDPLGRFFDSITGTHRYSDPILQVGLDAAFSQVHFDDAKYLARGGTGDLTRRRAAEEPAAELNRPTGTAAAAGVA